MKRAMDIEALLTWAYRDELPKRGEASGGGGGASVFEAYGTNIDCWSRDPGFPAACGETHGDAVKIDAAVQDLDRLALDWAADRALYFAGCDKIASKAEIDRLEKLAQRPRALVIHHAVMGTRPEWQNEPMRAVPVFDDKRGRPLLLGRLDSFVVKINRKTVRKTEYTPGSCCPLDFEPSPGEVAIARAEYMVWLASLSHLAESLSVALDEHEPTGPAAPAYPWLMAVEKSRRVLQAKKAREMAGERPRDWEVRGGRWRLRRA